jgi:hypothetical protein
MPAKTDPSAVKNEEKTKAPPLPESVRPHASADQEGAGLCAAVRRASADPCRLAHTQVLQLQRAAGNQAVNRLLELPAGVQSLTRSDRAVTPEALDPGGSAAWQQGPLAGTPATIQRLDGRLPDYGDDDDQEEASEEAAPAPHLVELADEDEEAIEQYAPPQAEPQPRLVEAAEEDEEAFEQYAPPRAQPPPHPVEPAEEDEEAPPAEEGEEEFPRNLEDLLKK